MNTSRTSSIDWEAAKRAVDRARTSLDAAFDADPTRRPELLAVRAKHLAERRSLRSARRGAQADHITFKIAGDRYALALGIVSAVGAWQPPAQLPHADPAVLGLFSSRGAVWALLDLGILFGAGEPRQGGYILYLRNRARRVALRVDALERIRPLDASALRRLPQEAEAPAGLIDGICEDGTAVIDPAKLCRHPLLTEGTKE